MNSDAAEDELVRTLLEPLGDGPDFTDTVRQMTGHARHRLPEAFSGACEETTAFLRATKPPGLHGKSKVLLAAVCGLAVGAAFFVPNAARQELKLLLVAQAVQLPFHGASAFYGTDVMRQRILARVPAADAEILFGDLATETLEDRWKVLAPREPANPGRQADAAPGYLKDHGKFPPDFVAKGEALDPGNGWYAYMQGLAAAGGKDVMFHADALDQVVEWPSASTEPRNPSRQRIVRKVTSTTDRTSAAAWASYG